MDTPTHIKQLAQTYIQRDEIERVSYGSLSYRTNVFLSDAVFAELDEACHKVGTNAREVIRALRTSDQKEE